MTDSGVEIRRAVFPADAEAIDALDTSFTGDSVFDVAAHDGSFTLVERRAEPAVSKSFPLTVELRAPRWPLALVAERGGRIVGFAAMELDPWNRRAVLSHCYVDAAHRGLGVGRALIETVVAEARTLDAAHVWLETSSANVPAVRAYERLGFTLCGLDTSLYDGTSAAGETALFMRRRL